MNYMKEVAEMLGVEIGEEFDIILPENIPSGYNPFKIGERGLVGKNGNLANDYLLTLLNGISEIKKSPWKPKRNEQYFFVKPNWIIDLTMNGEWTFDAGMMSIGNCFKTQEEAITHADEMVAKMKEVLK